MFFVFHVDKVDDNDSANIPKPQLPGNGQGSFHNGLKESILQDSFADKTPGIDVDRRHGLGLVKDQRTS